MRQRRGGVVAIPPPKRRNTHGSMNTCFLPYDAPLWKPPGVEMSYCSYGYTVAGGNRAAGQWHHSAGRLCQRKDLEPLRMQDTFYIVPDAVAGQDRQTPIGCAMFCHYCSRERLGSQPENIRASLLASGGVYSTAMDMAIFGQMFSQSWSYGEVRILSPAAVAEMTRNQIPGIRCAVSW